MLKHNAEKVEIFGKKFLIKKNSFGVLQFRMWIRSKKTYRKNTTYQNEN